MNLSIIIPAFNEAATIAKVLEALLILDCNLRQVIVVDDGSMDETVNIANAIAKSDGRVRVLRHLENMGKTAAIRTGLKEATEDIVIIQDADLEYDPTEIPDVIAPILRGQADVVYGSRFLVRKATRVLYFSHYVANKALTFFSNLLTNRNMTDVETCYKAFRREVLQSLDLSSSGFGMEIEITAMVCKTKARTYEVPISYYGRTYEEGKKIGLSDGIAALWYILYYNLIAPRLFAGRQYISLTNEFLSQNGATRTLPQLAAQGLEATQGLLKAHTVPALSENDAQPAALQRLGSRSIFPMALMMGVVAFLLLRYATEAGILVSPDSATYLAVAESLDKDRTFSDAFGVRLSHYPPGYPLSLYATSTLTGFDVRHGAPRFFHCVCYATFVAVSFVFFAYATGSRLFAAIACGLLMFSIQLLSLFASAWSDAPFLCAVALATYAICYYFDSGSKLSLGLAATFTAYAFLLRFVGIVWIIGFAMSMLYRGGMNRQTVRSGLTFVGISIVPMLAWIASGWIFGASSTNRTIAWHPVSTGDVSQLCTTLTTFFFVQDGKLWVCLGVLMFVATLAGFLKHIAGSSRPPSLGGSFVLLTVTLTVGYCGFLILSKSIMDRATPFDTRLLAPICWMSIPAAAISVGAISNVSSALRNIVRDSVIAILFVIVFGTSLSTLAYRMPRCQSGENGLNADLEKDQVIHRWLRDNTGERIVYSNKPWLPYLATKLRSIRLLPTKVDYTSGQINESYDTQVAEIRQRVASGTALVVYWTDGIFDDAYSPILLEELEVIFGRSLVHYDRFSTVGIPELAR